MEDLLEDLKRVTHERDVALENLHRLVDGKSQAQVASERLERDVVAQQAQIQELQQKKVRPGGTAPPGLVGPDDHHAFRGRGAVGWAFDGHHAWRLCGALCGPDACMRVVVVNRGGVQAMLQQAMLEQLAQTRAELVAESQRRQDLEADYQSIKAQLMQQQQWQQQQQQQEERQPRQQPAPRPVSRPVSMGSGYSSTAERAPPQELGMESSLDGYEAEGEAHMLGEGASHMLESPLPPSSHGPTPEPPLAHSPEPPLGSSPPYTRTNEALFRSLDSPMEPPAEIAYEYVYGPPEPSALAPQPPPPPPVRAPSPPVAVMERPRPERRAAPKEPVSVSIRDLEVRGLPAEVRAEAVAVDVTLNGQAQCVMAQEGPLGDGTIRWRGNVMAFVDTIRVLRKPLEVKVRVGGFAPVVCDSVSIQNAVIDKNFELRARGTEDGSPPGFDLSALVIVASASLGGAGSKDDEPEPASGAPSLVDLAQGGV
jgi:hypothetical protein